MFRFMTRSSGLSQKVEKRPPFDGWNARAGPLGDQSFL